MEGAEPRSHREAWSMALTMPDGPNETSPALCPRERSSPMLPLTHSVLASGAGPIRGPLDAPRHPVADWGRTWAA